MAALNLNYSFLKGTRKVKYEDYMLLQEDLMKALGTKTKQHYYQKRKRICNLLDRGSPGDTFRNLTFSSC